MFEYEYRPLVLIFLIEIILFFVVWLLFFTNHFKRYIKKRFSKKHEEAIAEYIKARLKGETPLEPKSLRKAKILLVHLENNNLKYSHDDWYGLKTELIERYVEKTARRFAKSFKWQKRIFAARCFFLVPRIENKRQLLRLIHDKKIIIQVYAAQALIALEDLDGIKAVIEEASRFLGYRYYLFRDFFKESSEEVFKHVVELSKDPKLQKVCISILATTVAPCPMDVIKEAISSTDPDTRKASIELIAHHPTKEGEQILIYHASELDQQVKIRAIRALGDVAREDGIKTLDHILDSDEPAQVKLAAAQALHKLGKLKDREKTELTEYVLRFG